MAFYGFSVRGMAFYEFSVKWLSLSFRLFEWKGIEIPTKITIASHTPNDPDQTKPNVTLFGAGSHEKKNRSKDNPQSGL